MFVLNFIFLNLYLHSAQSSQDSFKAITNCLPSNKLIETTKQVLCSTNSYEVVLLASERDNFDEMCELIKWLNRDCSFKAVQINTIDKLHNSLQYQSVVTVFIVNSEQRLNNFFKVITRSEIGNSNHKFLLVFKFEHNLSIIENIFVKFVEKNIYNIVIISDASIMTYNPFTGKIISINGTKKKNDVFVRSWDDLRGRSLVVSMYKQDDRAIPKRNGTPGYTGVDGLVADLLEERYNKSSTTHFILK